MAKRSRRVWRGAVGVALGVGAAVSAGIYGLGAYFARRIVSPAPTEEPLRVLEVNRRRHPHSITLTRGQDAELIGRRYSFLFDEGRGRVKIGLTLRQDRESIERELISIDQGQLMRGVKGRLSGWWYSSPEEIPGRHENITIETEVGFVPAWLFEPSKDAAAPTASEPADFAIHVHGRGGSREETLRGVQVFSELGWRSIVITYRNDPGAPSSPDGRYGLGTTEWRDVDAAIRDATSRGAKRVVLVGWSMGATAVLIAARESVHRSVISALVLESPAVSWPDIIDHHGRLSRVPAPSRRIGLRSIMTGAQLTGLDEGIPIQLLTPEVFAATLEHPTLIFASDGDTFVPQEPAYELARLRPDLVTLDRFDEGEHVKLWNVDPERWERSLRGFLAE